VVDGLNELHLSPEFSEVSEGFKIVVHIGWKKLTCKFVPGPRSGLLLIAMGKASVEDKNVFISVAENIISTTGNVELVINGFRQDPLVSLNWPSTWLALSISSISPHFETDNELSEEERLDELIVHWAGLFISMIFPLLPVVSVDPKEPEEFQGEYEGAQSKAISSRYERSRKNRQACLAVNGYRCQICNFDFKEVYGPIGAFYIEVHHIVPVSSMGGDYLINPVKDLVPLCANCHAMIHRKDPPFRVNEFKQIYNPE
jgi:5-methylcytosine-specific restriction protein A